MKGSQAKIGPYHRSNRVPQTGCGRTRDIPPAREEGGRGRGRTGGRWLAWGGEIAARPREAGNQAQFDRVGADGKYNWDRRGRAFRRERHSVAERGAHVDL